MDFLDSPDTAGFTNAYFFNKELSVANQMPASFSANHMTAVQHGVPHHGQSTAFSLRILCCFSVKKTTDHIMLAK